MPISTIANGITISAGSPETPQTEIRTFDAGAGFTSLEMPAIAKNVAVKDKPQVVPMLHRALNGILQCGLDTQ